MTTTPTRKISRQVYLDAEVEARLVAEARRQERPIAHLVRKYIAEGLEKEEGTK